MALTLLVLTRGAGDRSLAPPEHMQGAHCGRGLQEHTGKHHEGESMQSTEYDPEIPQGASLDDRLS